MTDETPDFVCRGCGYHKKNCVCTAQKSIKEAVVSGLYFWQTVLRNSQNLKQAVLRSPKML